MKSYFSILALGYLSSRTEASTKPHIRGFMGPVELSSEVRLDKNEDCKPTKVCVFKDQDTNGTFANFSSGACLDNSSDAASLNDSRWYIWYNHYDKVYNNTATFGFIPEENYKIFESNLTHESPYLQDCMMDFLWMSSKKNLTWAQLGTYLDEPFKDSTNYIHEFNFGSSHLKSIVDKLNHSQPVITNISDSQNNKNLLHIPGVGHSEGSDIKGANNVIIDSENNDLVGSISFTIRPLSNFSTHEFYQGSSACINITDK